MQLFFLLSLASVDQHLLPRQVGFNNARSQDRFEEFIESANASTVRELEVPNIHTNEYPSKGKKVKWKAWVAFDEEDAVGGMVSGGLYPDEDYIFDNGTVQSDDSWLTCLTFTRFRDPGLPLDEPIESDCSNDFSDDCLEFLNEFSDDGELCLSTNRGEQWKDSPCGGELNGDHSCSVLEPYEVFNVTHLNNLTDAVITVNEDGDPDDDRYNALVTSVYLLTVGFARASYDGNRVSIDRDAETVPSKFVCMRPDEFSDGSRTIEDIEDVGVGISGPGGWTMVLVACAVALTAGML